MATKKAVTELQTLDAQCGNLMGNLETALRNLSIIAETDATRELALVKTKIEEGRMWLDKYHAGVCIDLANKTCR